MKDYVYFTRQFITCVICAAGIATVLSCKNKTEETPLPFSHSLEREMVLDYDDEVEDLEAVDGLLGILMKRMWELQDSESCDDPYWERCEEVTAYIDSLYENEGVFHSDDPFYTDTLGMHYLAWVDQRDNLAKSMPTGVAKSYRNQTTNHIVNTLRYLHATSRKVLKTTIGFGNFLLLLCIYPLKKRFYETIWKHYRYTDRVACAAGHNIRSGWSKFW